MSFVYVSKSIFIFLCLFISKAHSHLVVLVEFADSVSLSRCHGNLTISKVLTDLLKLYAVHGIWTNAAEFTEVVFVFILLAFGSDS